MTLTEALKTIYGIQPKTIISYPPFTAPRMVKSDKWKKRPVVVKYFQNRNNLKLFLIKHKLELTDVLDIVFVVEMPKSWSNKKRDNMRYRLHKQRPDRDNFLKAYQDTFGGDDGFVADGRTVKIWGDFGAIVIF